MENRIISEKRDSFKIVADPFCSESNMNYLRRVISDIEMEKVALTEHELIEIDD